MRGHQAVLVLTALIAAPGLPAEAVQQESDAPAAVAEEPAEPIPIDLVETEQVRLIVLDVLVVDSKGRTVPGLTLDDFEVVAGGKAVPPVPPDTLDVSCDHALGDAGAVRYAKNRDLGLPPGAGGKVVLAFDYLHLHQLQRAEVLDHAMEMVQYGGVEGEEILLAALNGGLRIEQTFTGDHEKVHDSLRRMQHDITLWQPSFFHMSEIGWVAGMTTLFDVLGTVPGPKKVVFFSAMSHVPLDLQFRQIAAQAAVSRCSVYPVDAAGLTTIGEDVARVEALIDTGRGRTGAIPTTTGRIVNHSLAALAQLAVDTGGRYTERTNDLTLAYARAQRDLACLYSVGFYAESIEDRAQDVSIRVRRPGMRAIHPSQFVFRSESKKQASLIRAAWVSPEMFQTGIVRAHLFPLRPSSKNSWEGLLAIAFPVPLAASGGEAVQRDFGAVLRRRLSAGGEKVILRFNRRITLHPDSPDSTSEPTITFLQRVDLEPGRYELTAVLNDPDVVKPHADGVEIVVPEIPLRDLFLVGPMLGRRAGADLVVFGGGIRPGEDELGEQNSFEPLLVQKLDEADDLIAVTQACLVGSKKYRSKKERVATIERSLAKREGSEVGTLKPEELALEGPSKLLCQHLVDVLPATSLTGGEYVFKAVLHGGRGEEVQEEIRFAVGDSMGGS